MIHRFNAMKLALHRQENRLGDEHKSAGAARRAVLGSTLLLWSASALAITCLSGMSSRVWAAEVAAAEVADSAGSARKAIGAAFQSSGEQQQLVVDFDRSPSFTAHAESGGRRLIIDVPQTRVVGAPATLDGGDGLFGGAVLQTFVSSGAPLTRIIVSFTGDVRHSINVSGNQLVVRAAPRTATTAGAERPHAAAAPDAALAAAAESTPSIPERMVGVPAPRDTVGAYRISDVAFERLGDEHRLIVKADGRPVAQVRKLSAEKTRLVLAGSILAEERQRVLDVNAFESGVQRITSYRVPGGTQVDIEHGPTVQLDLRVQGSELIVRFFEGHVPSSLSGIADDGRTARRVRTIFEEPVQSARPLLTSALEVEADSRSALVVTPADQAAAATGVVSKGRYSGRRATLDVKDADIHNVLRLLADIGQRNIVTSDDVSGNVTVRLNNVPWDQALDVVLQSKDLGMQAHGNIIRVAPLDVLERERELAIARAQQELKLASLETRLIPVSYAQASDVQARARELLSGRGTIAVDSRTNVMIVRDVAGNLDQVEELTRALDTQTPQVLIEARIVEATSRYLRDVGIQWGGDASFTPATGNPTGLVFPNSIGLAGGASDGDTPTAGLSPLQTVVQNPNFAVNLPAAVGTGQGGAIGLTMGSVDSNFNLALRLSAAESNGMLRVLSSPRVLTLDNSQAKISQGTLIPFSQVTAQGVQTTFQEAKLQLLVRPHVTADGSVSMAVKINRDEPDFNQTSARGDPTILKREAETNLLVADGHTAVIGGIFTRNSGHDVDQMPFFGDIPLLGLLFQRRTASDLRSELVIFLTPRVINRAEALGR